MASDLLATKKTVRQKLLAARRALNSEERKSASNAITARFCQTAAYKQAQTLLLYASMADEVQLYDLMAQALTDGKTVALPLVTGTGEMEAVQLSDMRDLVPDKYGIKTVTPEKRVVLPAAQIDIIIVPGVGFTLTGQRLGLGGGFYDRYLLRAPQAKKIAFAYECQLITALPVADHDMSVDAIITEQQLITVS